MEEEYIFMLLIITVLSMLVISNTYHIYKLTKISITKNSLMDMQEFNNMHPMLKELYKEAVANGVFYIKNMIINDIIKMNDIDKWYNSNKDDIIKLIKLIKKIGIKNYKDNKNTDSKISPSELSKLVSIDIKSLIERIKEIESIDLLNEDEDIDKTKKFYDNLIEQNETIQNKYTNVII